MDQTPEHTPEQHDLVDFCTKVAEDSTLQESLKGIDDHEAYIEKAIALGKENGFEFNAEDLLMYRGQRVSIGELESNELSESGSQTCDFWLSPTCEQKVD